MRLSRANPSDVAVVLVTAAVYFQLYWHYWFVKMMGGYIVNTVLPIMILFAAFIFRELMEKTGIRRLSTYHVLIPLVCYAIFASVSVIWNEAGFDNVKRFFIYIYSPILIFLSMLWMHKLKRGDYIAFLLRAILIAGVGFSVYVAFIYTYDQGSVISAMDLETNRGDIRADTGATWGLGDLRAVRYTIPGMSSTTYGAILVPLVFGSLYFRKNAQDISGRVFYTLITLFLTFCILKTVSRGALVALGAGMLFMVWHKWFTIKEIVFASISLAVALLTFAKLVLFRLLITTVAILPVDLSLLGMEAPDFRDPRMESMGETVSYILDNPVLGMGMTKLTYLQSLSYGKEHNNYLSIAASFGSPAVIFYGMFLVMMLMMTRRRIKNLSNNSTARDLGIALGAGLFSLVIYLNFAPQEFHFAWIWFGLVAAWTRNREVDIVEGRQLISGEGRL